MTRRLPGMFLASAILVMGAGADAVPRRPAISVIPFPVMNDVQTKIDRFLQKGGELRNIMKAVRQLPIQYSSISEGHLFNAVPTDLNPTLRGIVARNKGLFRAPRYDTRGGIEETSVDALAGRLQRALKQNRRQKVMDILWLMGATITAHQASLLTPVSREGRSWSGYREFVDDPTPFRPSAASIPPGGGD